jgi:hypothetical protein
VKKDPKKERYRPTLGDLIMLHVFSRGEYVDGLWVGVDDPKREPVLERLRAALVLVKTYDPLRYRRLTRDLKRIWATPLHGPRACFYYRLDACVVNPRYVLAATTTPEILASTIVHEATHARLWKMGFRYQEEARPREEAICVRRQAVFSLKLPHGKQVHDEAEQRLAALQSPTFLSNAAFAQSRDEYGIEELRRLGTPEWAIRSIPVVRRVLRPFRAAANQVRRYRSVRRAN